MVFRQSDGLASNDVFSILVQDDIIWVGTANGISRYDGHWQSFAVVASEATAPTGVNFGIVTALAKSNQPGAVWAATDTGLLARWDAGATWQAIHTFDFPIHALIFAGDVLWIGTERGLFKLHNDDIWPVAEVGVTPISALAFWDDLIWGGAPQGIWSISTDERVFKLHQPYDATGVPLNGPFTGIWGDTPGHLWGATATTVFEYSIDTGKTTEYTPPFGHEAAEITGIGGVAQESVWVTSNGGGAAQFRLAGSEIASMQSWGGSTQGGLGADNVRGIATDRDGTIWFATSIGVFRYQPWAFQSIDERVYSLPVHDLLFDRAGQLWAATAGEGVQLRRERHRQSTIFTPDNSGLPGGVVFELEEDATGRIWAITDRGAAYFEAQRWRQPAALQQFSPAASGFLKADDLGIWIGGAKGLVYFQFEDESLQVVPALKGRPISAIDADSLGRLWVAGADGAIWRRSLAGEWQEIIGPVAAQAESLAPVTAFFAEAEPGAMLVAVKGYGIYRTQDTGWESVDHGARVSSDRVYTMMTTPDTDAIWVGSETGLARFDRYGSVSFDAQDGLQPGAIRAMAQDRDGAFWFGGDRGISYYMPEHGRPWGRLLTITGNDVHDIDAQWQVLASTPIEINFTYGDLQSTSDKLRMFVRLISGEQTCAWQELTSAIFQTSLPSVGRYTLEYMVRDQALNYSPVATVELLAVPAPKYTNVLLLGKVESRILQLLVLFGFLAIFGFGYVSFEIVQHRRRVGEAVARGYNPYISGEPVRREDMFFGRHALLQRIVSTLHNNSIMIHGERRIGKTTLLFQLANTLRQIDDQEYWFVALYIDLEGTLEDTFFHTLMEEIAQHIRSLQYLDETQHQLLDALSFHTTLATDYTDRAFSRDLRYVIQLLESYSDTHCAGRQVRLILLMDEIDTLSRYDHLIQQQLRRIFMREFAASVGAVVAGIEINKDWERVESPWFNLFNEIAMQPFTRDEAVELLVEPVRGYYIFEPDAIDFILQQSDGRPHRIQQYAMEAVNEMLRHKRRRITMHDVMTAHAIIQWDSRTSMTQTSASQTETFPRTASSRPV